MKRKTYAIPRHYEKLGRFFCELRQKKNLSQREVAKKLGYSSAQFISNFERGIVVPPLTKLRVLVRLLDMPIDRVLDLIVESERLRMRATLQTAERK